MKQLLILGAGRSSTALIQYLCEQRQQYHWQIVVADASEQTVAVLKQQYPTIETQQIDVLNEEARNRIVKQADLVISMLPARFHIHVVHSCLALQKNLITASYVSDDVKKLRTDIENKGLTFLYECGLDPGLDHMSAMKLIDEVKAQGGTITSFQSSCGGLMAPGSDDNPWRYKFTWNPRNVVLAGKFGTAQYLFRGRYKNIPHHHVFKRLSAVEVPDYGRFESYPNRDSLKYRDLYGIHQAETILRGTLRRPGFCAAWNAFVQLGLTDDSYEVRNLENMTYADFVRAYLPYSEDSLVTNFSRYIGTDVTSELMDRITWLGLLEEKPIGLTKASPADVLQKLLEEKWQTEPQNEDMIVMQHLVGYQLNGEDLLTTSSLAVTGRLNHLSGMAKTVGYPLGIAAKLILNNQVSQAGLAIPVHKEIYQPILQELEGLGIVFQNATRSLVSAYSH
ncbi:saccharopine dehydrogenase C-terminal domain-containing protein [Tunicatimonas pelagia]|uniref:saccharopine dehydrogenase C-terminal domain-containing protein n=1 Tax=Tunicatimonas pelagia TaxID=931531 RepID=UPI002664EB1D|nr:saccharopine dehydrogenase C-terminal domain-containing protein [Tunicatimonas pelagia]WKN45767.1 saccharopine dehydrogenase C-terminal domain-containing protein [Tunicatimonas pelagia]